MLTRFFFSVSVSVSCFLFFSRSIARSFVVLFSALVSVFVDIYKRAASIEHCTELQHAIDQTAFSVQNTYST